MTASPIDRRQRAYSPLAADTRGGRERPSPAGHIHFEPITIVEAGQPCRGPWRGPSELLQVRRADAIRLIETHRDELNAFGVRSLSIFRVGRT